jgi:hypothetical protein
VSVVDDGPDLSSTVTLSPDEVIFLVNLLGREAKALDDLERSGFLNKATSRRLRELTESLLRKVEGSVESSGGT